MTREEAKRVLEFDLDHTHNNESKEALRMAIKALEQNPCEDAISRREAIKKFTYSYKGERIPDYDFENFPTRIDIKTVKEVLRGLPSVTPADKVESEDNA